MAEKKLPEKFSLSLSSTVAKAMTDAQLDELGRRTDAKVLVDLIKNAADGAEVSDHMEASWSYSSSKSLETDLARIIRNQ